MPPRWFRWLAVALWCGLIYYFTATPAYTGPSTLSLLGQVLPFLPAPVHDLLNYLIRKAAHLTAFGILALLTRWAFLPASWASRGAWGFTTLYAASDEWHQTLVPGRSGTVGDVLLDSAGALLALGIWAWWQVRRQRRASAAPALRGDTSGHSPARSHNTGSSTP